MVKSFFEPLDLYTLKASKMIFTGGEQYKTKQEPFSNFN
jgi:hypothetical protein